MTAKKPTSEQIEAIVTYARSNGRSWKAELSAAWANGADAREPNGHLLRQVRNQFGGAWLQRFKLSAHVG